MRNIQYGLIATIILTFIFPKFVAAQDINKSDLRFEVNRVYPYISITMEELKVARTLGDLNRHYKPSWVREYLSVEITTIQKGSIQSALSKSETLSQQQKALMKTADPGTEVSVNIQYIPENTLKQNDPKEIYFEFIVDPDAEATYYGGQDALNQYLKEKAINDIPNGSFVDYDLTAVKFTVNEDGEILNPHIFQTSKNKEIDSLLLETIRNMPCWKPATYANGKKVKQEFVLTVGSMENCVINLLNIRREGI